MLFCFGSFLLCFSVFCDFLFLGFVCFLLIFLCFALFVVWVVFMVFLWRVFSGVRVSMLWA